MKHTDDMTSHQDLPKAQSNKTNKEKNKEKANILHTNTINHKVFVEQFQNPFS